MIESGLTFVSFDECLAVLDYQEVVDHLEAAHRNPPAAVADSYVSPGDDRGLLVRSAWADGSAMGAKLASIVPTNIDLPAVHALYVLFDESNGRPLAVIDGLALTWFKTACDSALGARHLARPQPETMVMVGAGAMAPHLVAAHLSERPTLRRVLIWNRTPARALALAADLSQRLVPGHPGLEVEAVTELGPAVAAGELISVATMTPDPLIAGSWLRPGAHLDLVGAYLPHMREADDEALTRSRIFVDSRATIDHDIGELAIPLARGTIDHSDVVADLYQLCSGQIDGRKSAGEITLFKNGGGGHLDLMVARYILDRIERS